MGESPDVNYRIIPKAPEFIDEYVGTIQVLVTHDGLIALEVLKPDLNLAITEDNRATYTGQWVSIARLIISPDTAKKLHNELENVLRLYEQEGIENGETD